MFINKDNDRFTHAIQKLNSSSEKSETNTKNTPLLSDNNSFLKDLSVRSEKSTKLYSQTNSKKSNLSTMDEAKSIKILLKQFEVIINKQKILIKTQFIPTSNGIRYVLVAGDIHINLSWLHNVKELEKFKILILYYELSGLVEGIKPTLDNIVLEFRRQSQMQEMLQALNYVHVQMHDQEVEKLYHFLC